MFRLALKITRVNGDVVDSSNAAVAAASCSDCQTVAVALQAVLIFSDASVITPTNFAFAYNLECERCYTLATAYQFVSTTGIVHFTAEGNRRIAEIRRQLEDLRNADLSIEEIQVRVDLLAVQLLSVMSSEIVSAGHAGAEVTMPSEASSVGLATPAEATASSTNAAPPPPTEAEPVEQTAEAPAERTADTTTETSGNDPTAGDDSYAAGTDSLQTTADTTTETTADTTSEPTAEPTAEPAAETSTP
jgi:putative peptide zinc metalloprotease protein